MSCFSYSLDEMGKTLISRFIQFGHNYKYPFVQPQPVCKNGILYCLSTVPHVHDRGLRVFASGMVPSQSKTSARSVSRIELPG